MRPSLLFVCHPLTGHVTPVLRIAAALRQRGWSVAFLSSDFFRARIEAAQIRFLPLLGDADLDDDRLFDRREPRLPEPPELASLSPESCARLPPSITDLRHQTLSALAAEWDSIKAALTVLVRVGEQGTSPSRRVMLVSEAFFYGVMPLHYGAPLPEDVQRALVPKTLCLSITAPAIRSVDLPPFGWRGPTEDAAEASGATAAVSAATAGHPPPFDPSPEGHIRNSRYWKDWTDRTAPLTELLQKGLLAAGARDRQAIDAVAFLAGDNYTCHDAIAQVGVPALEYPRSDFPAQFCIVGIVPATVPAAPPNFSWWPDLVAAARDKKKKVVVVAQGTVEMDPAELILPTLEVLGRCRDSENVFAVAILGARGACLSPEQAALLPAHVGVADYLAYDTVLPYADVWVHNGGYGATMHGIAHGVPMVIAGDGQDKPENGQRVQYSGLGIDLACANPRPEQLEAALEAVLGDDKYAQTARDMQQAAAGMDIFTNVENILLELSEAADDGQE